MTTEIYRPILCLDFDGVCHSYTSGWKGANKIPDAPVDGLFLFIENATIAGFDVQIFSSRTSLPGGLEAMREWFIKHRFIELSGDSFSHENFQAEAERWVNDRLKFPRDKPPAFVGIDDRVITFTGHWPDAKELRNFKPWNARTN